VPTILPVQGWTVFLPAGNFFLYSSMTGYNTGMRIRWSDMMPKGGLWHIARCELGRRAVPAHDHSYFEFFWVEEGQGTHRFKRRRHRLEPGQLWFIRPEDHHQVIADSRLGLTAVNVALEPRHVRGLHRRYGLDTFWPWSGARPVHEMSPSQVAELQRLAQDLATMDQRPSVLDGVMLRILRLLETGRSVAARAVPKSPAGELSERVPPPKWLAEALEAFAASESLEGGPGEFALLAHRTPEHVNRTMHAVFGCDTTTKLNALRMDRAGMLLRMNTDAILEICQKCGFASLSHFYTCFKAHHGATPRGYRLRATRALGPSDRDRGSAQDHRQV